MILKYVILTNFLDSIFLNLMLQCLLNCFLLNARFIIFRSKYDNSKPNINFFVQTIHTVKSSEYIIAKNKTNPKSIFRSGYILDNKFQYSI